MNNMEVAALFKRMAALLEFMGEDPYRVKAYEKAARNIGSLDEDVNDLYERGRIPKIPGVGKAIREKVSEILDTGTFEEYEITIAGIPPGIHDIMDVPGIGPKTAKLFYEKLDVTSIDELVKSAEQHRIRRLARMGPRQEEKILRSVQRHLENDERGRTPLAVAGPIAGKIMDKLRACPCIREIMPAGSLRRRKETVGNIDLLAISDDPEGAIGALMSLENVSKRIENGKDIGSVICSGGIRVDLRIVPEGSCGSFLQHFTGSKEHNVHLQDVAFLKGYSLSEHGLTDITTNTLRRYASEEDLYDFLGLEYPAPQLRENRGEIEAGMENRLPNLVDIEDIKGDLHVHSNWSDGKHSIEELAVAALERGYEYIAITDHSHSTAIANGLSDRRLTEHAKDVERANGKVEGIRLLSGTECDIRSDGRLDYKDRVLVDLDIVVASVHAGLEQDRKTMTKRIVAALENEHVDILAHPTGRKFGKRGAYDVDMEKVLQGALDNGKVLEINSSPSRLDLNDIHARMAKEMGVRIAINTDTHRLDNFDNIRYGIDVARRAWLEPEDVVNTRDIKELSSLLGID